MKQDSDLLKRFTGSQIEDLVKSNDALDEEEAIWLREEKEEAKRTAREKRLAKNPFRRLKKAPLEIICRSLFWFFLGSFFFSFVLIYSKSHWWFLWYIISGCACVFYNPNRKALKELLDAWPNILELINNRKK